MIEIGSFWIFSEKLGCFHRHQCFARVCNFNSHFHEVIEKSVKALKKMSSLEIVALSSLMLCRSKNAEKKFISIDIHYIHDNNDDKG